MIKYFFLLFLVFGLDLTAQEYSVSGTIMDNNELPISYATVVVKSLDSVILKGVSTEEEGRFKIEELAKGKYYIQASYIGNQSKLIPLTLDADLAIGTIRLVLEEQNLDEVVVTLQKPRLVQKADRLVFNIANTALSDSDVWDVLKKTPAVQISGGELQIKGQGNIGVMINNRRVNLSSEDLQNLLSGTSASNVESIEVITNPPIKYSAEGGMLINIVMRKNLIAGYNGSIYNTYKLGVFAKNTLGTDYYFKGKKTDLSFNYSFSRNKSLTKYTDITNYIEEENTYAIWTANQKNIDRQSKHNLNVFFDYYLDDKNFISLSSLNVITPYYERFITSGTDVNNLIDEADRSFDTSIFSDRKQLNTSYYADWVHKLKKKGAEVSFGSHYTFYDNDNDQALDTQFYDASGNANGVNDFTTESNQKINLYNVQLDYITPMGETSKLETGIRFAGIDSENTIAQNGFDRNQPGINPTESGTFNYNEDIYAAYASLNTSWDKFKLKTGFRMEYTQTIGDLDTNSNSFKSSYLELFPSLSLKYTISEKQNIKLNYYRRINRPRYNKINPFQYFQSNNSLIEGNPNLLPAIRNYIALEYSLNKAFYFAVFYRNEKNQYSEQVFQDNNSNLLRYLSYNIDSNISYGMDFSFNKNITNYWDTYILLIAMNKENEFIDYSSGDLIENDLWSWILKTRNSFTLLTDKSVMADVSFNYYSPIVLGNNNRTSTSSFDIDIRKTIWNKKASISIGISDIFRKNNLFGSRVYADQNNTTSVRREKRLFRFSFRYKFGNTKIKSNKKSKHVEERRRI